MEPGPGRGRPSPREAGKTLLVVDDEAGNVELLRMVVEATGLAVRVVAARDGLTALRLARDLRPDLILMDVKMPGMDGLEATRRLKADPGTAAIPVVAVTAQAMLGESVGLAIERRPVDLGELAAGVVEHLAPVAEQRRVELRLEGGGGAGAPVRADAGRIEQVLLNLVGNALKFTPGGGRITVAVADRGDAVEVAVADTGPGIGPDELPLLFRPFRQGRAAGYVRDAGTGLGLVICRHVVEAHGGRIWAESAPGQGARFVFCLPRTDGPPPAGGAV